jgi:molybdopterin-dependent oxidoreductase alpha subunit
MADKEDTVHYDGPAGGWGSLRGIAEIFGKEWDKPTVITTLLRQNKADGYACVSCAWTKPADPHTVEFCENGAKATLWELTERRCEPSFFAEHTVSELQAWTDYKLEQQGRLTQPMRYDTESDHYVPVSWQEAFDAIGAELKRLDPQAVAFYASGRASLECSYLFALFARLYGHNNLADSSNMCHETTSVALKRFIGSPVGTVIWEDLEHADAFFIFGQNTGSNSPRFLHPLQDAVKRGAKIVVFNPLREKGLESFINPQNFAEMITGNATQMSCQYHQVKNGGDIAAITGLCKHIFTADDEARKQGREVIDRDFISRHCHGFEAFETFVRQSGWRLIEEESGLTRDALKKAADLYISSKKVIGVYGMGLTQHRYGTESIGLFVNLLLLCGHIGKLGSGACPVRGHSNVQGQRTVGISEKPELVPLDKLAELFGFEPPRQKGMNTVDICEGLLGGTIKAFIGLGGNFIRAVPDQVRVAKAWPKIDLDVKIATKLNRSHLINGKSAWLLPCLGRIEADYQQSGLQAVSVEDSFSCIHGSVGREEPASPHLKSELAIVAGIAKATLPFNPKVKWDEWTADYSKVRKLIEHTYPAEFYDFEGRMFQPGGFWRGNSARERIWRTESGKAEFSVPATLNACGFSAASGRYRLLTLRSNDQFNTTIYGFSDRLRGIEGTRDVVLMNPGDIAEAGLTAGQKVDLISDADDGQERKVKNLIVTPYDLPSNCIAGYYPELNPLIPLNYYDTQSKTPAYKSVPVRIASVY